MLLMRLLALASFLAVAGCTRPTTEVTTRLSLRAPTQAEFQKVLASKTASTIPADKKACFGVHAFGPGISFSNVGGCGPAMGVTSGFVGAGEELAVDVPKGDARVFELLVFLAEADEACPALDASFSARTGVFFRTYQAGNSAPVDLTTETATVNIPLAFPGPLATIGSYNVGVCQPTPSLKGYLTSNGDVYDSNQGLNTFLSSILNFSYYQTNFSDSLSIGRVFLSGDLNFGSAKSFVVPPAVQSVTRKPDNGNYYGILADGSIVQVVPDGGSSTILALDSSTCPFELASCMAPPWLQSISAGFGKKLYGLAADGIIYELSASGPVVTGAQVSPEVMQVSFY